VETPEEKRRKRGRSRQERDVSVNLVDRRATLRDQLYVSRLQRRSGRTPDERDPLRIDWAVAKKTGVAV